MNFAIFAPGVLAFVASVAISFLILKFFPKLGFVDSPEKFNFKRKPIPLPGGVGAILVFVFLVIFSHEILRENFSEKLQNFAHFQKQIAAFLIAIIFLTTVSFVDDRKNLSPILRIGAQICAAGILIFGGIGIDFVSNPFGDGVFDLRKFEIDVFKFRGDFYQFNFVADFLTIFWVIFLTNCANWLDGVVGLSPTSCGFSAVILGILSLSKNVAQNEIAILAFIFAGAIFGFLIFNFPPPRMLFGDAGAMPAGFILAVLAIFSGGKIATAFLVFAVPIFDAIFVIFWRLKSGRKIWCGRDGAHFHDELLRLKF